MLEAQFLTINKESPAVAFLEQPVTSFSKMFDKVILLHHMRKRTSIQLQMTNKFCWQPVKISVI